MSSEDEAQLELKRQKDTIRSLRQEKTQLSEQLAEAQGKTAHAGGARYGPDDPRREGQVLKQRMTNLRRQLDVLQSENSEKRNQLQNLLHKKEDLVTDAQPLLTDGSSLAQRIRTLENRLDKALIKHNEAVSIRRTYEQILARLEEERVGYDNQLAAIEKTLRAKEHDNQQLEGMAHDARYAKEAALMQVQRFKEAYAQERQAREREMEERHKYVNNQFAKAMKQEKAAKVLKEKEEASVQAKREEEERQRAANLQATTELRTEEEEQKLQQLSAAYRRIRDVTRAVNVDQVIAMFAAQRDTYASLAANKEEIERQIEELQITRAELRRKLDDAKYSGTGNMGSRRIVDEFEAHLTEARALLSKSTKDFERVSSVFMGVRAGVEHLNEKLSGYRSDLVAATPVTEITIKECLDVVEQKLTLLMEEAATEVDAAAQALASAEVVMPQYNVRVKLLSSHDEEVMMLGRGGGEGGQRNEPLIVDHHDDDPHDRLALKKMSQSAQQRAEQMRKKKQGQQDTL